MIASVLQRESREASALRACAQIMHSSRTFTRCSICGGRRFEHTTHSVEDKTWCSLIMIFLLMVPACVHMSSRRRLWGVFMNCHCSMVRLVLRIPCHVWRNYYLQLLFALGKGPKAQHTGLKIKHGAVSSEALCTLGRGEHVCQAFRFLTSCVHMSLC